MILLVLDTLICGETTTKIGLVIKFLIQKIVARITRLKSAVFNNTKPQESVKVV
jgi:hypothetical protein